MRNEKRIKEAIKNVITHEWGIIELKNCGLTEIPKELLKCEHLVFMDFSNSEYGDPKFKNRITEIPDEIINLKNLSNLNLKNNAVKHISTNFSHLSKVKKLNLENNDLTDLPEEIANMKNLEELGLAGNPFDLLPPEIVSRGMEAIRNFYAELKEKDFLYEAKLIIVGEGRVGKTCITKALIDPHFELCKEDSTEGINLKRWIIPKEVIVQINPRIERDLQINIWDFGGQEIYHSTHQFFLTKRSLYLLVTESRKEDRHDDFFYWLNIIKLLGDESPVMMVLNKCDQPVKEIPIKEYQSNFKNIVDFDKISLTKTYRPQLDEFKTKLITIASQLPHIGSPLPKKWIDIRLDLEELKIGGRDFISYSEYLNICLKHYRREESAQFLGEYFHDLGVIIHFQDDLELKDLVILNHEWITKGVYKVLDDEKIIKQKGKFTLEDISRIWNDSKYSNNIRELLSLMKNAKFDLCFQISTSEFLIPRLLPVDKVDFIWETNPKNLKYELRYKFMPKGILTRLIVKLNSDIYKDKYWRYGVILENENTKAIIREKYFENKIIIELNGINSREYLYLIRKQILEIHKDFNNVQFNEMIPCICKICVESNDPHFYQYNLLKRYEENLKMSITCEKSLEDVSVLELTSNVAQRVLNDELRCLCENQNASMFNSLGLAKTRFYPETDSYSVFIGVTTNPTLVGLRDRDFLLDSEIDKLENAFPNYYILEYYCIENYLFHPDNLEELNVKEFNKDDYIKVLIEEKNKSKNEIISNYKNARKSYPELKFENNKFRSKSEEAQVMSSLESDLPEDFLKFFSLKDHFNKTSLQQLNIQQSQLSQTIWFRMRITKLFEKKNKSYS